MPAVPADLLRRAADADYRARVGAAEQLSLYAGDPVADNVLRRLLLDPEDTAVTQAAATALLFQDREEALRLYLWALGTDLFPPEEIDHLADAHLPWNWHLHQEGADALTAFARQLARLADDPDPDVARGARGLLRKY